MGGRNECKNEWVVNKGRYRKSWHLIELCFKTASFRMDGWVDGRKECMNEWKGEPFSLPRVINFEFPQSAVLPEMLHHTV